MYLIPDISSKSFTIILVIAIGVLSGVSIVAEKWTFAVLFISPILIYLCIQKPFIFPFGIYAMLIPFDFILGITEGPGPGPTITKYLGIISIIIFVSKGIYERKLSRSDPAVIWWALFIIYGVVSALWAINPDVILLRLPTILGLFLLYLVVVSYDCKTSEFEILKKFIFIGGLLASLYLLYHSFFVSGIGVGARASLETADSGSDPNAFAFTIIVPVSICVQLLMSQKNRIIKSVLIGSLGIMLYAIILTGSRGGFLAICVVFATYTLLMKKRIVFSMILIVIAAILISFMPDFFAERWLTAGETGGAGRFTIWYIGWKAFEEYWAFGAGLNNFPYSYGEFAYHDMSKGWSRSAHNIYVRILIELGVVGFSIMVMVIIKHYKAVASKVMRHDLNSVMLKAALWAVLFASIFLDTFWHKAFWMLWIIIILYKKTIVNEAEDGRRISCVHDLRMYPSSNAK